MKFANNILFSLVFMFGSLAIAEDCLPQFHPLFVNQKVNFSYHSDKPKDYYVQNATADTKGQCKTTFKDLQEYLNTNFKKAGKRHPEISLGWNYLAIDQEVVYNYLLEISPTKLKINNDDILQNSDFKRYIATNQAQFQPRSIFNKEYACYYHQQYSMVTGMAHPFYINELACTKAGNEQRLSLGQITEESEVVSKLLHTDFISNAFIRAKVATTGINSYMLLNDIMTNSGNDELGCIAPTLNADDTSFALSKLNPDGSINLVLGLTSDIAVCSQIYHEVQLTNIHPKFKITQLVESADF